MPKNNKVTEKVFAGISSKNKTKGNYQNFLNIDNLMGLYVSTDLMKLKERYSEIVQDCIDDINLLGALEEIIIQIRCKEVIDSELRLSLSRKYIYARSTFYRRGNQINDIRVIVGKLEDFDIDDIYVDQLLEKDYFRLLCKTKLLEAMNKEIEKNIQHLNYVYNEEKNN